MPWIKFMNRDFSSLGDLHGIAAHACVVVMGLYHLICGVTLIIDASNTSPVRYDVRLLGKALVGLVCISIV